jgi:D-alanyl-D-alanine carboxypeptidase/D-alanyl-D-alanine-endopeptidase (penicillin-binding protein 4)
MKRPCASRARRRGARVATLVAAAVLVGCAVRPHEPPRELTRAKAVEDRAACSSAVAAPTSRPRAERAPAAEASSLEAALVASPALRGAVVGAYVTRSDGGVLLDHHADLRLVPASTQKLLTAAAALRVLGPEFRFRTEVRATSAPRNGVIEGALVVVGAGDPSIGPRMFRGGALAPLDDWAAKLSRAGVRAVRGELVADAHRFATPLQVGSWELGDRDAAYAVPMDALMFHESAWSIALEASRSGGPPLARVAPFEAAARVRLEVESPGAGSPSIALVRGDDGAWTARGSLPAGASVTAGGVARDPSRYFVDAFRHALDRAGIDTQRAVPVVRRTNGKRASELLLVHESPPLSELIVPMLEQSVNLYADALLLAMSSDPERPSFASGAARMRAALGELGLDASSLELVDGSGLSRWGLVTPRGLVTVLRSATSGPGGEALRNALPVAGRTGTLRGRMKGAPLEGRVRAKTGTLHGVRCLAGELETTQGERLFFAFLVNGSTSPNAEVDAAIEAVLLALASRPSPAPQPTVRGGSRG